MHSYYLGIGGDDPDKEDFLRGTWEEGDDREYVLKALKSGVEVRPGLNQEVQENVDP
jgi:hypothetical protein